MKVTDVRMEAYRWNRTKPIRNGRYVYPTAGLNAVKVETDEGITGVGLQDVHVHLVSAIPNGLTVEYYRASTDPMWGKMFMETLEVEDGHVSPPDRPGIGIELNEEALAPHRVA